MIKGLLSSCISQSYFTFIQKVTLVSNSRGAYQLAMLNTLTVWWAIRRLANSKVLSSYTLRNKGY